MASGRTSRPKRPDSPPVTPDGRYFVVRGRLWRLADPSLPEERRRDLVAELMAARRAVKAARQDSVALKQVRARIDAAKRALGERGPVWWSDGAPDYNRRPVAATPYDDWHVALTKGRETTSGEG